MRRERSLLERHVAKTLHLKQPCMPLPHPCPALLCLSRRNPRRTGSCSTGKVSSSAVESGAYSRCPRSVRSVWVQPAPCPRQGVSWIMILCLSPISSEGWVTHGFLSHRPTGDTVCWSLEYTTKSFLPRKSFSASSGTRGPGGPLDN